MLSIWHYIVSSRALRDIRCTTVHRTVQVTVAGIYCVGTVRAEFCADRSTGMECAGRNSVTPYSKLRRLAGFDEHQAILSRRYQNRNGRTDGHGLHIIHNVFLEVFCAICKARLSTAAWSGFERRHLAVRPRRRPVLLAQWALRTGAAVCCLQNEQCTLCI
jgi:hypothetical protein